MQPILSADSTELNLLTRDGMVSVTFSPVLTPDDYVAVGQIAAHECSSAEELRNALQELAAEHGYRVEFP